MPHINAGTLLIVLSQALGDNTERLAWQTQDQVLPLKIKTNTNYREKNQLEIRRVKMLAEKKMLDLDLIETQSAVELPDRTLPLVTIVIANVLNGLSIDVDVRNIKVAVQVCAVVDLISTSLLDGDPLTCTIQQ
jgi:hypothetical protein